MVSNEDNTKPMLKRDSNYEDVVNVIKRFKDNNSNMINLISIGAWNSPHVNIDFTTEVNKNGITFNKIYQIKNLIFMDLMVLTRI